MYLRCIWVIVFCLSTTIVSTQASDESYSVDDYNLEEFQNWKSDRLANLKRPFGWLSLIGLEWVKEGSERVGSHPDSDIVLPHYFPEYLGQLNSTDLYCDFKFEYENIPSEYFDPISLLRNGELTENKIEFQSFQAYLIERNGKYGLRMKDSLASTRMSFQGIDYFPFNKDYVVEAEVLPAEVSTIMIENVLGMFTETPVVAKLRFNILDEEVELLALDGGPDHYFLIFSDETSGLLTYGGGRYIDVRKEKTENEHIVIDFNRSYNPPCVYTDYATCPLPPQQNKLKFEIIVGELSGH